MGKALGKLQKSGQLRARLPKGALRQPQPGQMGQMGQIGTCSRMTPKRKIRKGKAWKSCQRITSATADFTRRISRRVMSIEKGSPITLSPRRLVTGRGIRGQVS